MAKEIPEGLVRLRKGRVSQRMNSGIAVVASSCHERHSNCGGRFGDPSKMVEVKEFSFAHLVWTVISPFHVAGKSEQTEREHESRTA
jgi:hypothetical protein